MTDRKFSAERVVAAATALGIVLRIAAGLWRGLPAFEADGYTVYLDSAHDLLAGQGLRYALWRPLYPLWLALFQSTGFWYPGVIIGQSVLGGGITWVAWRIGADLFDRRVGVVAAIATAVNPYLVIHDTALQDTVMFNALVAATVWLLLRALARDRVGAWFAAGVALAATLGASNRIVLFVPCAIAWAVLAGTGSRVARWRRALAVAIPTLLLLGASIMGDSRAGTTGTPVSAIAAPDADGIGFSLWLANNPGTFSHFPAESIDRVVEEFENLPAEQRAILDAPQSDADYDRLLTRWALEYIVSDPLRTIAGAARKLWVVGSAQLSPARGRAVQFGFALLFLPVNVLASIGWWRTRFEWRRHALIWLLVLSFAATTAVFWAHTSHKSYLDPILFVYAAATISRRAS